ncbi:hypothetical protein [Halomonas sp. 707B3]|uniref:hypothetical protein n=1 Tax=Halomonas sp. 707B3 TaxID=1681043 RepID=UPI00209DA315|nr:hypothetical protein [Halomonas sp. 707B3]MCP1316866.1 hypothetical protein [Halomonas sp. 707B3]
MARPKTFDLSTVEGRQAIQSAYEMYMRPHWTLLNVAAAFEVSPNTLRRAFAEVNLPLKINHDVRPTAVLKEQRTLRCPVDYLAAKYSVTPQAVYRWAREYKRKLVDTGRAASQRWWDAFYSRYDDPNDAVIALTQKPHGIPLHAIPPLYHKRVAPDVPVIWMLDSPTPYNEIELDTFTSYSGELTVPCDDYAPQLWLGYQDVCNPVQWADDTEQSTLDPDDEDYSDDVSDLDLESLAADLGIDL